MPLPFPAKQNSSYQIWSAPIDPRYFASSGPAHSPLQPRHSITWLFFFSLLQKSFRRHDELQNNNQVNSFVSVQKFSGSSLRKGGCVRNWASVALNFCLFLLLQNLKKKRSEKNGQAIRSMKSSEYWWLRRQARSTERNEILLKRQRFHFPMRPRGTTSQLAYRATSDLASDRASSWSYRSNHGQWEITRFLILLSFAEVCDVTVSRGTDKLSLTTSSALSRVPPSTFSYKSKLREIIRWIEGGGE